ncbi:MAG: peptide chain release factor N(5)-glutamine methyltransferase [Dehalococcoidia bacterium]|nr:peptide chain release factor N(5)-glutamine methyltransferase [Dehalococcoidia bacterium]MDP7240198.1 peptide chain release factor N(5)-glutamine methyltransferase [Dehalococcoidia bacterium]
MTLWDVWRWGGSRLHNAGIPDALLESEVLLRHSLGLSRAMFFSRWGEQIYPTGRRRFRTYINRRLKREPTAYILRHREFYGLGFFVDPRVLIPRPETELLVEKTIELVGERPLQVVEVGTGCGAVAIALAHYLPLARLSATEISPLALQVARRNRRHYQLGRQLKLLQGDLLLPLSFKADIIVANLPYVRNSDIADLIPEVRDHEPLSALAGGPDGLDLIRRLVAQVPQRLKPGGWLLLEVCQGQAEEVTLLLERVLGAWRTDEVADLAGVPRLVMAQVA